MSEPLTNEELNQLAVYEAERERGLVHNLLWVMKMQELQERHDAIRDTGAPTKRELSAVLGID